MSTILPINMAYGNLSMQKTMTTVEGMIPSIEKSAFKSFDSTDSNPFKNLELGQSLPMLWSIFSSMFMPSYTNDFSALQLDVQGNTNIGNVGGGGRQSRTTQANEADEADEGGCK